MNNDQKPRTKKYYWLKLHKDFFTRHDIRVIESMPNGKDYVLFYLKLLTESISYQGELRFSETIPYNESMLATITNTNIDTVRSAMKVLKSLNLVSIKDDQTIYLEETNKMLGEETEYARKKREYRKQKAQSLLISEKDNEKTLKDNVRQEIEIETELEIELDTEIYKDKAQTSDSTDSLESISLIMKDGTLFNLDSKTISIMSKAYPNKDINIELNKMSAWLYANPQRRKTKAGMKRFINNWLSRGDDNQSKQVSNLHAIQPDYESTDDGNRDVNDLMNQLDEIFK